MNDMETPDAAYYNALAVACDGDYAAIKRVRSGHRSWRAAWESAPVTLRRNIAKEWERMERSGARLILREDADFPESLREIPHPPFGLYVKGVLPRREIISIAIVGTRKATMHGKAFAEKFSVALAAKALCIVSGLALGIDAAAHKGALRANGTTVGVLACGLDRVYPSEHVGLAKEMLGRRGALMSEYPVGSVTLPYRFLERNRIVSGLSKGIVVIEAPEQSGALATARFALDQNRDVFVVPGRADDPVYAGAHELIKSGAALVTSPEDVLRAYGIPGDANAAHQTAALAALGAEERRIYDTLKENGEPLSVDKLSERVTLPIHIVTRALTFLQLKGFVRESSGAYEIS